MGSGGLRACLGHWAMKQTFKDVRRGSNDGSKGCWIKDSLQWRLNPLQPHLSARLHYTSTLSHVTASLHIHATLTHIAKTLITSWSSLSSAINCLLDDKGLFQSYLPFSVWRQCIPPCSASCSNLTFSSGRLLPLTSTIPELPLSSVAHIFHDGINPSRFLKLESSLIYLLYSMMVAFCLKLITFSRVHDGGFSL